MAKESYFEVQGSRNLVLALGLNQLTPRQSGSTTKNPPSYKQSESDPQEELKAPDLG